MNPKDAWLATLGQLQIQLHKATYETWVRDSRFLEFEDGVFVIAVKNAYAKDWLEKRLHRQVTRTLSKVYGTPSEISVVVQAPAAKPVKDYGPLLASLQSDAPAASPTTAAPVQPSAQPAKRHLNFADTAQLNQDYRLDNFIVGDSNEMGYTAARAIGQDIGRAFNPLMIFGGSGLGKTHLLQAIGNAAREKGQFVIYVSGETFTNDLIRAIRGHQMEAFREHYRNADVFLIDDVQFIAGKDSTQQELLHTFNELHNLNKHIIIGAPKKPSHYTDLDERLVSRFESGLAVEMKMPDYQTRYCILHEKARAQDIDLPDSVASLLAETEYHSVREIEGLLNKLILQVALTRQPVTEDFVLKLLTDEQKALTKQKPMLEIEDILQETANYHQLSLDDLLSKQRNQEIALARHIAIYLAREEINATLPAIGRALGGRTHSTILNSIRKVEDLIHTDPAFRRHLNDIRSQLYAQ